jgi:O-antigen/teichoic acid export membrane protein
MDLDNSGTITSSQDIIQPMLSELKRFFVRSGLYASGDILTKGVGLLLLPLYTAYLMPSDYGILAVANVVTAVAGIVLTLGLNGSALKFYYDLKGDERRGFYGSLWLFLVLVPGVILILMEFSANSLFNAFFTKVPYSPYMRLALWTAYFTVAFTILPKELFRAAGKAIGFTMLNVGQFTLAAGFTIWLVVVLRQGAAGALWASLISVVGIGIVSSMLLWNTVHFTFDLRLLKRALVYSLPLLPHFLSHWILNGSDRIILERYAPLSEVGVYTVGYQIGSAMMMFTVAGNNSLIPLFGRLDVTNHKDVEKLMRIVTYYILGLTIIGLCISLFSPEILYLMTPSDYHHAAIVVPWVVLGCLFMALYCPAVDVLNLVVGDTRKVVICTVGAALVNVGLNLWLIPKYGAIAAAVTTAIAYMLLGTGIFAFAHKALPVPYEYKRIGIILGGGLVTFLIGWNLSSTSSILSFLLKVLSLAIFPGLLWLSRFFNQQESIGISQLLHLFLKESAASLLLRKR